MPQILRRSVPETATCALAADHVTALYMAWQRARPGDRLILIVDEVEGALTAAQTLAESFVEDACAAPIGLAVGA